MFKRLAKKLVSRGWTSIIPLKNPGKEPWVCAWQLYNTACPSRVTIDTWAKSHPNAGIGLVLGPDQVLAVDSDFLDPALAKKARDAITAILGKSDLERVGRAPKAVFLYRSSGKHGSSVSLGGLEIFTNSKQIVMYGTHPETFLPYNWPVASPLEIQPRDLPPVTADQLAELTEAVAPYCHRPERAHTQASTGEAGGHTAMFLRAFADGGDPVEIGAQAIITAKEGDRHHTAVGAVVALAMIGLSDAEIEEAVVEPYLEHFSGKERAARKRAIVSAITWARQKIGPDENEISAAINANKFIDAWNRRWHRS